MKNMLIAGNWKMNTLASESVKLCEELVPFTSEIGENPKVVVCPPFTNISAVYDVLKNSNIGLGAQNCHYLEKGAFTGEISLPMLKELNCEYVIIGHSERRKHFCENDEYINKKAKAALQYEIKPIVCIGETQGQRKDNNTFLVLEKQITEGLRGIDPKILDRVVIAYEPVWAIGTGVAATVEQIEEAHKFIRFLLDDMFGKNSDNVLILYGGSVDAENSHPIFKIQDVNGALIGGASLKIEQFTSIIKTAKEFI